MCIRDSTETATISSSESVFDSRNVFSVVGGDSIDVSNGLTAIVGLDYSATRSSILGSSKITARIQRLESGQSNWVTQEEKTITTGFMSITRISDNISSVPVRLNAGDRLRVVFEANNSSYTINEANLNICLLYTSPSPRDS